MSERIAKILAPVSLALCLALPSATPARAQAQQGMSSYEHNIVRAAAIYTVLAFSPENRAKRRKQLPLSKDQLLQLNKELPPRFQACMEGAFSQNFRTEKQARDLRMLMEHTISSDVPEPAGAEKLIPGFKAANKWCSSRIPLWTSATLN